ncbi:hypothetical protein BABINDRAFT_39410 [Babjeviella inositovora NRRL Y-12698]|uniref:ATPase inhibitor, mitochondrial n=1 Tax=Babjeviella inositovora NRRL Y-12698 TaxID=984486 RepID=A0A1E3QL99_9ASCO|nr:uncharacterized protein BABINDRAFT_39410 [Babjeviella inositovora NRRL Y-12698]ODQ78463.1 hypothetical protein BABINDRAFT_39410 [Babjeviella inositovora NRRL Y-12698]
MLSQISRRALTSNRAIAMRMYSEGATGAPRGASSDDAFSKREAAQENLYVKQHEKEQLAALRKKLAEQEKTISDIQGKLDDLEKK